MTLHSVTSVSRSLSSVHCYTHDQSTRTYRDLRHVIIIDTNKEDFSKQPHNGILIKKWNEDLDDTALLELIPFLEAVCKEDIQDVRQVP